LRKKRQEEEMARLGDVGQADAAAPSPPGVPFFTNHQKIIFYGIKLQWQGDFNCQKQVCLMILSK